MITPISASGRIDPDCAEPVIGRRCAPTRWLHPGYDPPRSTDWVLRSSAVFFGLVVDQARDLSQALAVAAAADHIGHATLGPKQRAILILPGIAHLRRPGCRARGVDREALARCALIHQKRCRAGRAGQQPAADELQPGRVQFRCAYVPAAAL